MKNQNTNKEFATITKNIAKNTSSHSLTVESITELELALTNSAIGYEYAKEALEKVTAHSLTVDKLIMEIENHKNAYFEAREKLKDIDVARLASLESNLREQKQKMFSAQSYLQ